uniref:Uncharacterized protein n=1 Tax=Rhizophora mucronata TaxID=61149 RepID=A0A2P2N784_RHIMU
MLTRRSIFTRLQKIFCLPCSCFSFSIPGSSRALVWIPFVASVSFAILQ